MADIRREKFNKQGQIARDLADLALSDIDEALADHRATDHKLLEEEQAWDDYERVFHDRRPGEIGAVVTRLSFRPDFDSLPEPPEAA